MIKNGGYRSTVQCYKAEERLVLYNDLKQRKEKYCTKIKNGGKRSIIRCYKADERSVLYNDQKRRKKKCRTML